MERNCMNCNEKTIKVPYVVHESAMARAERYNKRLWAVILSLCVLLIATNMMWLAYERQFEVVEETVITQENENGYNNYIGSDGDINNGEANYYQKEISS